MEAGERWMLNDVAGKPIRTWDSRRFLRRMTYDELRRPTGLFVTDGRRGATGRADRLWREAWATPPTTAPASTRSSTARASSPTSAYDFKGNLRESRRELLPDVQRSRWIGARTPPPTTAASPAAPPTTRSTARSPPPHRTAASIARRSTRRNLLDKVEVEPARRGAAARRSSANIDYNAKGQRRASIAYRQRRHDDVRVRPAHVPPDAAEDDARGPRRELFPAVRMTPKVVQDLRYTYDPVGNITRIEDAALKTVFHDNQRVEPVCGYTYDALYRLIEAQGREHIGQTAHDFDPPDGNRRDYPFAGLAGSPTRTTRRSCATTPSATSTTPSATSRSCATSPTAAAGRGATTTRKTASLEPGKKSNRLTRERRWATASTAVETYTHDAHGNMTTMPHLPSLAWDFEDRLQRWTGGGGTAYYVYDAAGQRVRKVIARTERHAPQRADLPRRLRDLPRSSTRTAPMSMLERESLHVMDDSSASRWWRRKRSRPANAVIDATPLPRYQLGNHLGSASVEFDRGRRADLLRGIPPVRHDRHFQAGRSAAEVSLKRYRYTGQGTR